MPPQLPAMNWLSEPDLPSSPQRLPAVERRGPGWHGLGLGGISRQDFPHFNDTMRERGFLLSAVNVFIWLHRYLLR